MEETNTQIAWPSKLKIGAKSKKGKIMKDGEIGGFNNGDWNYWRFAGRKLTFILIMYVPK